MNIIDLVKLWFIHWTIMIAIKNIDSYSWMEFPLTLLNVYSLRNEMVEFDYWNTQCWWFHLATPRRWFCASTRTWRIQIPAGSVWLVDNCHVPTRRHRHHPPLDHTLFPPPSGLTRHPPSRLTLLPPQDRLRRHPIAVTSSSMPPRANCSRPIIPISTRPRWPVSSGEIPI